MIVCRCAGERAIGAGHCVRPAKTFMENIIVVLDRQVFEYQMLHGRLGPRSSELLYYHTLWMMENETWKDVQY
jgi:hypothetical protein